MQGMYVERCYRRLKEIRVKLKQYIKENYVMSQEESLKYYNDLDSKEETYQKKKLEFSVKKAEEQETVDTMIDGKKETTNKANAGDYILTGSKGERYVLTPEKFNDRYVMNKRTGKATTKQVKTRAKIAKEPISIKASWGEKMIVEPGDAIVNNNGEIYRIEKEAFKNTYEKV